MLRPTWAEVNVDHLSHNVRALKSLVAPHVLMMVSVKANGYGHGAYACSVTALSAGADQLGVATIEEGLQLRKSGITAPILVYGALPSIKVAELAAKNNLMLTIGSSADVTWCERAAQQTGKHVGVHVKVDTGMVRLGVRGIQDAVNLLQDVNRSSSTELRGVYTHFADADEPLDETQSFTEQQRMRFDSVLSAARSAGIDIPLAHASNSAGILRGPQYHYDMVRPGIACYGYYPRRDWKEVVDLRPVLSLYTTIVRVARIEKGESVGYGRIHVANRKESIATLPIGYADGVPRNLSNIGCVRIKDILVTIAGRVCMDQMMIRVTGIQTNVGDKVAIYDGTVEGGASMQTTADHIDTSPYELLCRISERVPRVYIGEGAERYATLQAAPV